MVEASEVGVAEKVAPPDPVISKEKILTEDILGMPLEWHGAFDSKKYREQETYHNSEHIRATEEAKDKYVQAVRRDRENDPLRLMSSLDKWNRGKSSEMQVSEDELVVALKWVVRFHDVGNILRDVNIEDGEIKPVFLEKYTAGKDDKTEKVAEDRSRDIFGKVIRVLDMDEKKQQRLVPLVKKMIELTKPKKPNAETGVVDTSEPFSAFMEVVDQIGNDLYSTNVNRVEGLMREIVAENPDAKIIPDRFVNYSRRRLPELLPEESDQEALLEIWRSLPDEISDLPTEKVRIDVYLK